jgi:xanthine dehydrogenase FAD-binding subunit
MAKPGDLLRVLRPKSVNGLLRLFAKNSDALLFAGGTERATRLKLDSIGAEGKMVIYLGKVGELSRIRRSQRYLEIGSCVPISRIVSIGKHILPQALSTALRSIANPAVRNQATLGGNICSAVPTNDSLAPLYAIDGQLELRSVSGSRWVPISRYFHGSGDTVLQEGEILFRIRIPLEEWDFQCFRKVSASDICSHSLLNFCGLARFSKGILETVRIALGGLNNMVFRSLELESRLEGKTLPLSEKEVESLLAGVDELLEPLINSGFSADYCKATYLRLLRWFLDSIHRANR